MLRRKIVILLVTLALLLSAAGAHSVAQAWDPICPPAGMPPPC